jgi:hypothetical protein
MDVPIGDEKKTKERPVHSKCSPTATWEGHRLLSAVFDRLIMKELLSKTRGIRYCLHISDLGTLESKEKLPGGVIWKTSAKQVFANGALCHENLSGIQRARIYVGGLSLYEESIGNIQQSSASGLRD